MDKTNMTLVCEEIKRGVEDLYTRRNLSILPLTYIQLADHVVYYCSDFEQMKSTEGDLKRDELHGQVKNAMIEHLRHIVEEAKEVTGEEAIITFYIKEWHSYRRISKIVRNICRRLIEHYTPGPNEGNRRNEYIYDIQHMALVQFKEYFFSEVHEKVTNAALSLITRSEFNGENLNNDLVSGLIRSYLDLGVVTKILACLSENTSFIKNNDEEYLGIYQEYFEAPWLHQIEMHYTPIATKLLQQLPLAEYMEKVNQLIDEEQSRIRPYLHGSSTSEPLRNACKKALIEYQLETFHNEFKSLLPFHEEKGETLMEIYDYVVKMGFLPNGFHHQFQIHLDEKGMAVLNVLSKTQSGSKEEANAFVKSVFELNHEYKILATTSFRSDDAFASIVKFAIRNIANFEIPTSLSTWNAAELFACFFDFVMKGDYKTVDNSMLDIILALEMFEFLDDKGTFQKLCGQKMIERLVSFSSVNAEYELFLISELETKYGAKYVSNLQRIYRDMLFSKDLNDKFREFNKFKIRDGDDGERLRTGFQVQVFSSDSWPFVTQFKETTASEFAPPPSLIQSINKFNDFAKRECAGKKLTFMINYSQGNVLSTCFKTCHVFKASVFQISVLLLFNSMDSYCVSELVDATKLNLHTIIQVVRSLVKSRILMTESGTSEDDPFTSKTVISLCKEYNDKRRHRDICEPHREEVDHQKVRQARLPRPQREEDGLIQIQGAIVRIMKTKKVLNYEKLVSQVMKQAGTYLAPNVKSIKKCIDTLIEENYLGRIPEEMDTLTYLLAT